MKFADEKRFALGLLAGCAALPLPLNEPRPEGVVGWGFLLLFELGVVFFLLRVRRGEERWLGNLMLNLMGLVYLPFLVLDVTALSEGRLLRPMMHLAMFVVIAKLYSLRRDRDKWQTLVAIFFIFVTAMATSASPGIVVYMLVFAVLAVRVLNAFARYHLLAADRPFGESTSGELTRSAVGVVLASVVLAIPLFVLLPRFREPFVLGSGSLSQSTSTGFSDEAGLDVIGRIRTSREVALRLEARQGRLPRNVRLRGATFDLYAVNRWERSGGVRLLDREPGTQRYRLTGGDAAAEIDVWLEPIGARALIVPQETLAVEFASTAPAVGMNRGGALGLPFRPRTTLQYSVLLDAAPVYLAEQPAAVDEPLRDLAGVTPEVTALARQIVGEEDAALERARRIERHLVTEYTYTLDFVGRMGSDPVADFLFEHRSGHCEYFASAMVLLLRSLDIPARYVTGFLGAEESSLGYSIVRQSNAHAWVEAYIEGRGWMTFEPTPPEGRPGGGTRSLGALMRQAYDFMIFRWDRYVITFSQGDQARFFRGLREWVSGLFSGSRDAAGPAAPPEAQEDLVTRSQAPADARPGLVGAVFALLALLVLWAVLRPRRLDPMRAYRRLQRLAAKVGVAWNPSMAPRQFERLLIAACPAARREVHRIVGLYLRQSFSGRPLLGPQPSRGDIAALDAELRRHLTAVTRAVAERRRDMKRAAKLATRAAAPGNDAAGRAARRRAS